MTTIGSELASGSSDLADPVNRLADRLSSHNVEAIVVDTRRAARDVVPGLIPEGAERESRTIVLNVILGDVGDLIAFGRRVIAPL